MLERKLRNLQIISQILPSRINRPTKSHGPTNRYYISAYLFHDVPLWDY